MKRTYELTVVLSPQLSPTDLTKLEKSLESLIKKVEGQVNKKEDWGTKELNYPISKQVSGAYRHWQVELNPEAVEKLDRELKLTEGLMRHLIVSAEK